MKEFEKTCERCDLVCHEYDEIVRVNDKHLCFECFDELDELKGTPNLKKAFQHLINARKIIKNKKGEF